MNRNKIGNISDLAGFIANLKNINEIENFMTEILTISELETLSKRWRILNMLNDGYTQRDIAQELKVSLCKVTRGSGIIKNKNSVTAKYLIKENKNEI